MLDPSRGGLYIGLTGIDGATFKCDHLMNGFAIQVNKTSRNTVRFTTNIGTTRSSVAYLIEVLMTIAHGLDQQLTKLGPATQAARARTVCGLTNASASLPDFSGFHPAFRPGFSLGDPNPTPERDVEKRLLPALRRRPVRIPPCRRSPGQARQRRGGRLCDVRDPVPAGFPRPRARSALQRRHPEIHAESGHSGGTPRCQFRRVFRSLHTPKLTSRPCGSQPAT